MVNWITEILGKPTSLDDVKYNEERPNSHESKLVGSIGVTNTLLGGVFSTVDANGQANALHADALDIDTMIGNAKLKAQNDILGIKSKLNTDLSSLAIVNRGRTGASMSAVASANKDKNKLVTDKITNQNKINTLDYQSKQHSLEATSHDARLKGNIGLASSGAKGAYEAIRLQGTGFNLFG